MLSDVSGCSAAVRPTNIFRRHALLATGQPATRRSVQKSSHNGTSAPPLHSVAHRATAHRPWTRAQPPNMAHFELHQPANAQVHQNISTHSTPAIDKLKAVLPKMALLCCLLCMGSTRVCLPLVMQQAGMLSLAGFLLPLQTLKAQRSLARFQHSLQAAAAEAETEEAASPVEQEPANDNGVIESGAELGSVQTPASVWLPYNTSVANSKVRNSPALATIVFAKCHEYTASLHSLVAVCCCCCETDTPYSTSYLTLSVLSLVMLQNLCAIMVCTIGSLSG